MIHLTGKMNLIMILVTIYQKYQMSSLWKTKASYKALQGFLTAVTPTAAK